MLRVAIPVRLPAHAYDAFPCLRLSTLFRFGARAGFSAPSRREQSHAIPSPWVSLHSCSVAVPLYSSPFVSFSDDRIAYPFRFAAAVIVWDQRTAVPSQSLHRSAPPVLIDFTHILSVSGLARALQCRFTASQPFSGSQLLRAVSVPALLFRIPSKHRLSASLVLFAVQCLCLCLRFIAFPVQCGADSCRTSPVQCSSKLSRASPERICDLLIPISSARWCSLPCRSAASSFCAVLRLSFSQLLDAVQIRFNSQTAGCCPPTSNH